MQAGIDIDRVAGHAAGCTAHQEGDDAADLGERQVPVGTLDVVMHRDDVGIRPLLPEAPTSIPVDLTGTTVILTDDVLFTGRTVRAALDALADAA